MLLSIVAFLFFTFLDQLVHILDLVLVQILDTLFLIIRLSVDMEGAGYRKVIRSDIGENR